MATEAVAAPAPDGAFARAQRHAWWSAPCLTGALVAGSAGFVDPYLLYVATSWVIFGLLGLSLDIVWGKGGILSFGHLAFAAVGAYVSAWLTLPPAIKGQILPNLPDWLAATHLPFLVALPIAALAAALFGAVTGAFISRLGGAAAAIKRDR